MYEARKKKKEKQRHVLCSKTKQKENKRKNLYTESVHLFISIGRFRFASCHVVINDSTMFFTMSTTGSISSESLKQLEKFRF
jgi:hypothetical protein